MIQEKTVGNTLEITVDTYDGDAVTHSITKEAGNTFHIGGTASHRIIIQPVLVISVYIDEADGLSYCDFSVPGRAEKLHLRCRTCGEVKQGSVSYMIETLDLEGNLRWLVIDRAPEEPKKHFINVFEKDAELKTVKVLRIDPFFGNSRII